MIQFSTDCVQLGITKNIIEKIQSLPIILLNTIIELLYQLLHNECERYVECIKYKQEYRHLFQKNNTQYIEFLTKYGEMINELLMRYTVIMKKANGKKP